MSTLSFRNLFNFMHHLIFILVILLLLLFLLRLSFLLLSLLNIQFYIIYFLFVYLDNLSISSFLKVLFIAIQINNIIIFFFLFLFINLLLFFFILPLILLLLFGIGKINSLLKEVWSLFLIIFSKYFSYRSSCLH